MRHPVTLAIIKTFAKAILLTAVIGAIIAAIGYINRWNSSLPYSNAFFIAGSLMIIAGASARYAAGQQTSAFRSLGSESFRDMSSSERADFIVNISSSLSTVILGILTGMLLIVISAIAARIR